MTPYCTAEITVKSDGDQAEAHPLRCKRWSCPVCSQINRAKVIRIARKSKPRALLTLTVSSKDYPDPDHAAQQLKEGLRLLRLRLKRHPKLQNFQFMAVFERHKSGHPHLHLLIKGAFLPWQELRRMWEAITGSFMVDIRKINSEGMAALYVAKYIGKDLAAFKGCKRWWRSHSFSDPEDADEYVPEWAGRWSRHFAELRNVETALKALGFEVEPVGREGVRWRRRPHEPLGVLEIVRWSNTIVRKGNAA